MVLAVPLSHLLSFSNEASIDRNNFTAAPAIVLTCIEMTALIGFPVCTCLCPYLLPMMQSSATQSFIVISQISHFNLKCCLIGPSFTLTLELLNFYSCLITFNCTVKTGHGAEK